MTNCTQVEISTQRQRIKRSMVILPMTMLKWRVMSHFYSDVSMRTQ